jgi:hypothetical protein
MARVFLEMAACVKFLYDVQKVSPWIALESLIFRIPGDALPCFDEVPITPVAIEDDPVAVRETVQLVLWDLHCNDEVVRTDPPSHPTFQLDQTGEKLCGNVSHESLTPF